jgi:hypothetical protein
MVRHAEHHALVLAHNPGEGSLIAVGRPGQSFPALFHRRMRHESH